MPKGAGLQPAGTSPAGIGAPDVASAPVRVVYPDPSTALSQTGPYINPRTGQYVYTADGRKSGMPTMSQLVELAILNNNPLAQLTDKTPNYQQQVAGIIETQLAAFVKARQIQIVDIQVNNTPGVPDAGYGFVIWRDLTMVAPGATGGGTPTESKTFF